MKSVFRSWEKAEAEFIKNNGKDDIVGLAYCRKMYDKIVALEVEMNEMLASDVEAAVNTARKLKLKGA